MGCRVRSVVGMVGRLLALLALLAFAASGRAEAAGHDHHPPASAVHGQEHAHAAQAAAQDHAAQAAAQDHEAHHGKPGHRHGGDGCHCPAAGCSVSVIEPRPTRLADTGTTPLRLLPPSANAARAQAESGPPSKPPRA